MAGGKMGRILGLFLITNLLCGGALGAPRNPFLGKWDITAKTDKGTYIYWLEVKDENGQLAGYFLNRTGSVLRLPEIALKGDNLIFSTGGNPNRPNAPKPRHQARVVNGKLIGELTTGGEKIPWVGVRPPRWGSYNANKVKRFGPPITLFDGKDLAGWRFQFADQPSGWSVADGLLTNEKSINNIISIRKFQNFKLQVEYKLANKSNSGIYLRGRYELQVLDDAGAQPNVHGHMSIYSRVAPTVNAAKRPGSGRPRKSFWWAIASP
jgi:hypothetical protein